MSLRCCDTSEMTRAMLLCAGLGTRLGALSDERPKPLLPVCNVPILRYGIDNLVAQGIDEIVINLHHRGDLIRAELGDGGDMGARIHYLEEKALLGTGGALKNAIPLLDPEGADEPFLSLNGKLIFDLDVRALLAAHRAEPEGVLGTMVVRRSPEAASWGAVDVAIRGVSRRVKNILGNGDYMFCGVHVTRPSVVARLPPGEACMVRQGYLPWLRSGEEVAAYEVAEGYFAEHSTPRRYLESNFAVLRGSAALRHPPAGAIGLEGAPLESASTAIVEPVCIAPGATVGAGARIGPDVVIGAGAEIAPGAILERAVVWPGALARGEVRDAIVTRQGCFPADDAA